MGESCGTGVGGLGLPAGCWPPVTSGRLRARTCQRDFLAGDAWRSHARARLWHQHTPRCCVILLTRPARAPSPSPVQWRQSHHPPKTTQGLTLVKGRAQRERGRGVRRSSGSKRWEWTGRRPGQGGHGTPPLPWPLWPGGFSAMGEGLPPTRALSELRGEEVAQCGHRRHPGSVRSLQPSCSCVLAVPLGPRWSESGVVARLLSRHRGPHWNLRQGPGSPETHSPAWHGLLWSSPVRRDETEACRRAPSLGYHPLGTALDEPRLEM